MKYYALGLLLFCLFSVTGCDEDTPQNEETTNKQNLLSEGVSVHNTTEASDPNGTADNLSFLREVSEVVFIVPGKVDFYMHTLSRDDLLKLTSIYLFPKQDGLLMSIETYKGYYKRKGRWTYFYLSRPKWAKDSFLLCFTQEKGPLLKYAIPYEDFDKAERILFGNSRSAFGNKNE